MEQQRWGESEKRREEKRGEEKRREERRGEEKIREEKESKERVKRKSQKKESKERVKRKSQKKETKERVKRKSQKKEDAGARTGGTVAKHCVYPMICGYGGSKSRLAKAAGAEPSGQMRDEKFHAVVVRSTFGSQNAQNTSCSGGFWKLRCRKSVRRCGTKHISKSKCTKDTRPGPLLEVDMSKKYTPLWREAHVQVKMCRTHQLRTTFGSWDIEKLHAVAARSTCRSQKCKKLAGSEHFWTFGCRFAWQAQGILHLAKVSKTWRFCSSFNYNHYYTTLHYNYSYNYNYNYITLQYPTPTLITLHL